MSFIWSGSCGLTTDGANEAVSSRSRFYYIAAMPVITLQLNTLLSKKTSATLLRGISELTASVLDKPLGDVMVMISRCDIARGGEMVPAAFIDCRHIGTINAAATQSLCTGINHLLQTLAGIEASMVYANFTRVEHEHALRFDRGTV